MAFPRNRSGSGGLIRCRVLRACASVTSESRSGLQSGSLASVTCFHTSATTASYVEIQESPLAPLAGEASALSFARDDAGKCHIRLARAGILKSAGGGGMGPPASLKTGNFPSSCFHCSVSGVAEALNRDRSKLAGSTGRKGFRLATAAALSAQVVKKPLVPGPSEQLW